MLTIFFPHLCTVYQWARKQRPILIWAFLFLLQRNITTDIWIPLSILTFITRLVALIVTPVTNWTVRIMDRVDIRFNPMGWKEEKKSLMLEKFYSVGSGSATIGEDLTDQNQLEKPTVSYAELRRRNRDEYARAADRER